MRLTTAIFSLLWLTACAGNSCGVAVKAYSVPEQQAIVRAWNALPDDSALQSPLNDWERMRIQLK